MILIYFRIIVFFCIVGSFGFLDVGVIEVDIFNELDGIVEYKKLLVIVYYCY